MDVYDLPDSIFESDRLTERVQACVVVVQKHYGYQSIRAILDGQLTRFSIWLIQASNSARTLKPNKACDRRIQDTVFKALTLQNVSLFQA